MIKRIFSDAVEAVALGALVLGIGLVTPQAHANEHTPPTLDDVALAFVASTECEDRGALINYAGTGADYFAEKAGHSDEYDVLAGYNLKGLIADFNALDRKSICDEANAAARANSMIPANSKNFPSFGHMPTIPKRAH